MRLMSRRRALMSGWRKGRCGLLLIYWASILSLEGLPLLVNLPRVVLTAREGLVSRSRSRRDGRRWKEVAPAAGGRALAGRRWPSSRNAAY